MYLPRNESVIVSVEDVAPEIVENEVPSAELDQVYS
jgi:hypothetical protein